MSADLRVVGWVADQTGLVAGRSHPSCRLEIQNRLQEGGFNLALAGVPGSQIQLQVSSDLVTWTPLRVLTNTQGRIEFPDPVTQGTPQRFYRALPME